MPVSDFLPGPAHDLGVLANALTVLFSIIMVLEIVAVFLPATSVTNQGTGVHINGPIALILGLMTLGTAVVFLAWFYRARQNAARSTYPQGLAPGWAIGGWFLPPVFLWFPYRIMADIWRAGRPPDQRSTARDLAIPGWWWASWLLAWFTSFQHRTITAGDGSGGTITSSSYALNFGGTRLSAAFGAVALIFLIVIIRRVSAGPVGNPLAERERSATSDGTAALG